MGVTPSVIESLIKLIKSKGKRKSKSSKFEIRIQSQDSNSKIEVLFSVDQLTQSGNFENLLQSNQTLLPKANLFLMTCSTSVQI
jgi:hypothetical protein